MALGLLTQEPDALLAGVPNTNARVFINRDRTTTIELDIAVDATTTAAAADYPAYRSAASRQVPHQTSSSSPSIGTQTDEFVGSTNNGRNVVAISFVLARVICVLTYASSQPVDRTTVEVMALTQAAKIRSANP
ncbi:MAG TPA: hypothetical protein VLO10_04015 [Candidatus Deferrimicrobium sp.]|nr:hypothetical protein [Candidatus Deferrimicrobium sp.]